MLPHEVSQRHRQLAYLVQNQGVTSHFREITSSANTSRFMAEISPAPIPRVIGNSIGLEMSGATCQPATAPGKKKINTFANSETVNMPSKDFLGMTISCDMLTDSTEEDYAAARMEDSPVLVRSRNFSTLSTLAHD